MDAAPDSAPDAATNDAASDGGVPEADAAPTLCDVTAPFTSSSILKNLNLPTHEYSATLMPDEKTIFFSSSWNPSDGGSGLERIFTATRTSVGADFSTPMVAPGVNLPSQDTGDPSLSPDGLTMYLVSPTQSWDIYVTTRNSLQAVFGNPQLVGNVNSNNTEIRPAIRADGKELFFASDRASSPYYRLFHATLSGASFSTPTEITEIESAAGSGSKYLQSPVISADGLTLYFAVSTSTTGQVWIARRATVNDPFGGLAAVSEINAGALVVNPVWLSADNCRLYVTQIVADGGGDFDLYVYSRTP